MIPIQQTYGKGKTGGPRVSGGDPEALGEIVGYIAWSPRERG